MYYNALYDNPDNKDKKKPSAANDADADKKDQKKLDSTAEVDRKYWTENNAGKYLNYLRKKLDAIENSTKQGESR